MNVAVVIPTYNRGHLVARAARSALAQSHRALEVLVVDDGSTDDTAARVRTLADARVRYVALAHRGVSATRNAGVALATAEIVAFLDSDDVWRPDKLEREVAFLDRHPEVDAVFSDLEKHDGSVFVPSFMRASPIFARRLGNSRYPDGVVLPRRQMYLDLLQEVFVKPSALTMRRAAFLAAGGFDESWSSSEDWEFLLRFSKRARFGFIDRPLAELRVSGDSLHRIDQPRGDTAMLRLLAREWRALRHDAEARAAARRGLRERVKQFAWYWERQGRRGAATVTYVRGAWIARDPGLLVRAPVVWVPRRLRMRFKMALGRSEDEEAVFAASSGP